VARLETLIMNYEDVKAKLLWNWSHDEPIASEIYTDDALRISTVR
jgi:hypothetical protein